MTTQLRTAHEQGPAPPAGRDLRGAPRYPIVRRCLVWPAGARGADGWRCIAYNVSATGVGVALPVPLPPGSVLSIRPHDAPGTRPVQARVIHATTVEWLWFSGCAFAAPLGEDELQAWLGEPPVRMP